MRRRTFIASATGTAAAAVPLVAQRRAVGMSDVARAAAGMNALVEADDRQGGHAAAGEGRSQGPHQRAGAAAAQRRRTRPPRPVRTGRRVHDHRGLVLHRRPQPRPGAEVPERIVDVRRPLPGRPHRNARVGQPLDARLPAPELARSPRSGPGRTSLLGGPPRPLLRLPGPGPRRPRLRGPRRRPAGLRSLGAAQDTFTKAAERERPRWTAFYGPGRTRSPGRRRPATTAEAHPQPKPWPTAPWPGSRPPSVATGPSRPPNSPSPSSTREKPKQATATAADVFTIMDGDPLPRPHAHPHRRLPPGPVRPGPLHLLRTRLGRPHANRMESSVT